LVIWYKMGGRGCGGAVGISMVYGVEGRDFLGVVKMRVAGFGVVCVY